MQNSKAGNSIAPWTLFLFCLVMFYMQHKGRGKATKVVEFVAKWLNFYVTTVDIFAIILFEALCDVWDPFSLELHFKKSIDFWRVSLRTPAIGNVDCTKSYYQVFKWNEFVFLQLSSKIFFCWLIRQGFLRSTKEQFGTTSQKHFTWPFCNVCFEN